MTPSEFEEQFHDRVKSGLNEKMNFIQRNMMPEGELRYDLLRENLRELGTRLVGDAQAPENLQSRMDNLSVSLLSDPDFDYLMKDLTRSFSGDERLQTTMQELVSNPDSVNAEDYRYALDQIVGNEHLLMAPIGYISERPNLREAAGIPDDFNFEGYVEDLRRSIEESDSLEGIRGQIGMQEALMGVSLVGVAVVILVSVAVVVHTVAAAVNYAAAATVATTVAVFTAAGGHYPDTGFLSTETAEASLRISNRSERLLWLVVETGAGIKRYPFPSGAPTQFQQSLDIIGLIPHHSSNEQSPQIHYLDQVFNTGITLHGKGEIEVREENGKLRLQTPYEGECTVEAASGFNLKEVAAAYPPGFDADNFQKEMLVDDLFYQALNLSKSLSASLLGIHRSKGKSE